MKVVSFHEYGSPSVLRYEEVDDPVAGAGEVLVRVAATSVNPVDWKVRSGGAKAMMPVDLPYIPGTDLAGVVLKTGPDVTAFKPGDRVIALATSTYAELCVTSADELVLIPDGLGMDGAAVLPLVNITGNQLVREGAKAVAGQSILITGALGSVGRSAVFAAREIGCRIVAGVRRAQLDAAAALPGVDQALAVDDDAAIDSMEFVDCVADTIGGALIIKLLPHVREGGTFGTVDRGAQTGTGLEINAIVARPDATTTLRYAEAVRDGRLIIPCDHLMPLSSAAEAHRIAEKGGVAKIVLKPAAA